MEQFSGRSVEIPKVVKQNYPVDLTFNRWCVKKDEEEDEEDEDEDEEDEDEDEEEEMGENEDEEDDGEIPRVTIVQKCFSSFSPKTTPVASSSLDKMTLELMMNPQYLSKANPEAFQKKIDQAQRILKHRRDIQKTLDDCFDALHRLVKRDRLDNSEDNHVDLDIQTGFLHFAKTVLFNLQQQQNAGRSNTEPIFSGCQDIHSSFYPEYTE